MGCERARLMTATLSILVATAALAAKGSSQVPATADFGDRAGDKILSVGGAVYADGNCVIAWVDSGSGQFFFRTASRSCNREILLDLSQALERQAGCDCSLGSCPVNDAFNQAGELDICGANTVGDVRWIAGNLFGSSAPSAGIPLTLRINLEPNFEKTAFELQFEQSVAVEEGATTSERLMSADSNLVAELYKYTGKGNNKIGLGRFHLLLFHPVERLLLAEHLLPQFAAGTLAAGPHTKAIDHLLHPLDFALFHLVLLRLRLS